MKTSKVCKLCNLIVNDLKQLPIKDYLIFGCGKCRELLKTTHWLLICSQCGYYELCPREDYINDHHDALQNMPPSSPRYQDLSQTVTYLNKLKNRQTLIYPTIKIPFCESCLEYELITNQVGFTTKQDTIYPH